MDCPHCHKPIDPDFIRKAANADAARKKRPGARGLIRNPKGRAKNLCSLCGLRPRSPKCPVMIDGEAENICKVCYDDVRGLGH